MLSDRIGRKKVYLIGFLIQVVWIFITFKLIDTKSYILIGLGMVVLTIPLGMTYGPQAALFAEMFPARIRYSGAGLANAFGAILGGAFAPFIASYLCVVTVLGLMATVLLKDRTGRDLSAAADAELNARIDEVARTHHATEATFDRGAGF